MQCRNGNLHVDMYAFFHGLPTFTSPLSACQCNDDVVEDKILGRYKKSWAAAFMRGCTDMAAVIADSECAACKKVRQERHRVLTQLQHVPKELHAPPFSEAPAVYSFNIPRYYSLQVRAREYAKQHNKQLSWCYARDVPLHPGDRDLSSEKLNQKITFLAL